MTGTALPTVNTAASAGDKTVGMAFGDAITAAETAISAASPWFYWTTFIWKPLFTYFGSQIGLAFGTLFGYVILDIETYTRLTTADAALTALNAAKATGDINAIEQASQNVDASVAPVLHYIGSASSS